MPLLGVEDERIRQFADTWSDSGLWDDIAWLSRRVWDAGNDDERRLRWHHLVMAVGNFKRLGGRRLRPEPLASAPGTEAVGQTDHIRIPGGTLLTCEDPASWAQLKDTLPGAATSTTTTLLAALWPTRHFILDWRVLAAVAGLDVTSGGRGHGIVEAISGDFLEPTLDRYRTVRELLIFFSDESGMPLQFVERGLYVMSKGVKGVKGRKWAEYGDALRARRGRTEPAGTDGEADDEQTAPPPTP
jgi:hypothetical protein